MSATTRQDVLGATAVRLHQRDGWFPVVHVSAYSVIVEVPDLAGNPRRAAYPFASVVEVRGAGPQRIQLRRARGWRKPEGAIVVARPSKWGNPWTVYEASEHLDLPGSPSTSARQWCVDHYRGWLAGEAQSGFRPDERAAILADIETLRGHDLGCWCPVDQPCHGDVLLELANGGA